MDIDGGAPQVLASAPEPRGGTWSVNGTILFTGDTRTVMRVAASGRHGVGVSGCRRMASASSRTRFRTATTTCSGRAISGTGAGHLCRLDRLARGAPDRCGNRLAYVVRAGSASSRGSTRCSPSHSTRSPGALRGPAAAGRRHWRRCRQPFHVCLLRVRGRHHHQLERKRAPEPSADVVRSGGPADRHRGPPSDSRRGSRSTAGRGAPRSSCPTTAATRGFDVWLLDLTSGAAAARLTSDGRFSVP